MTAPALQLTDVRLSYPGTPPVDALRGVSLHIGPGEFVAIQGSSGSGKSTLLNVVALLDRPDRGEYLIDGEPVLGLSEKGRAAIRSRLFGFVFQGFHLLDSRPVVDSVELGLFYRAVPARRRRDRALAALTDVGLAHRAHDQARLLSGGERQRVAVARALAVGAPLIMADEPTGNLDSTNGAAVVDLLASLVTAGRTVVLVTHDPVVAARAHRRVVLQDGRVLQDSAP